jgi:hypothetical protein
MERLREKAREHKVLITALFKGEASLDPNVPQHLEAVDTAAKMVTYPFILDVLDNEPGRISDAFRKGLDNDLTLLTRLSRDKREPLAQEYAKRVREHALEVIESKDARPIAQVNAARTLARLYELGQADLADSLLKVLTNTKLNDGTRFYALRGLRDLLGLPGEDGALVDKKRMVEAAAALVSFLKEPPRVDRRVATQAEVDGFRLLRREAIRALAQTRLPMVDEKTLPALELARFAGNDERIAPPLRLDERLEAAIGLGRMRASRQVPDFQIDYAVWQIGVFLEAWGRTANLDRELKPREHRRPWKIDAVRLAEVLSALKVETKDAYVKRAAEVIGRILSAVGKGDVVAAGDLRWFANNKPPSQELFKGMPDTIVRSAPWEPFVPPSEKPSEDKERP